MLYKKSFYCLFITNMIFNKTISDKQFTILECLVIIGLAAVPLFVNFPYRVNIFLSWEGAYRMYLGQTPYKDFGLPMGYGYWIIPSVFFHLFGPFFSSLIKAQFFINIVSGLTFRGILTTFNISEGKRFLSVLVFCISYSFFNFWPWYNHTVFVYQFIGFYFLLHTLLQNPGVARSYGQLVVASFFLFLSFFTKQDGGALGVLIAFGIIIYHVLAFKKYKEAGVFIGSFALVALAFVLPYINHDFGYWFNLGQKPHNSRFSLSDILDAIFGQSQWIKFYVFGIVLVLFTKFDSIKEFWKDKMLFTFSLLTIGILTEAAIVQVTSYTPPDNNIFYHSFAFAFLFAMLHFKFSFGKVGFALLGFSLVMLWWSGAYWKYIGRIVKRYIPQTEQGVGEEIVSKNTFMIERDTSFVNVPESEWILSGFEAFDGVYMPPSTVEGMRKIKNMQMFNSSVKPKVLNMTELTPLAHVLQYDFELGQPLWYHKNVAVFDKGITVFCEKIANKEYDLVLFERVPYLNNFYPDEVLEALQKNYKQIDTFLAPRRPTDSTIEVYVK